MLRSIYHTKSVNSPRMPGKQKSLSFLKGFLWWLSGVEATGI